MFTRILRLDKGDNFSAIYPGRLIALSQPAVLNKYLGREIIAAVITPARFQLADDIH